MHCVKNGMCGFEPCKCVKNGMCGFESCKFTVVDSFTVDLAVVDLRTEKYSLLV